MDSRAVNDDEPDAKTKVMTNEFIEPTREGRRNLLLIAAVGIIAAGSLQFWLKPLLLAQLASLPLCERLRWLRICLLGAIATPPAFALWAVPHALRLHKFGQSPLPGTWVFRRTPIRRGRIVRLQAAFLLLFSLLALMFPIVGWHMLESTPIFAARPSCS